jgi:hypothetical protein
MIQIKVISDEQKKLESTTLTLENRVNNLQKLKLSLYCIGLLTLVIFGLGIIFICMGVYFSNRVKTLEKKIDHIRQKNIILTKKLVETKI